MIADHQIPKLLRGVRVHVDKVRKNKVLLAPERAFTLNDVSLAILEEVDGVSDFQTIIDRLAKKFNVERNVMEADCSEYLMSLQSRILLELV